MKRSIKEAFNSRMKLYFIDAMGAMALGLFASLLIGTIFGTLATYTKLEFLNTIAGYAKAATGMAIGVAIAYKLSAHPLVIFSCAAVGAMSNAMGAIIASNGGTIVKWAATASDGSGIFYAAGPAGAFFAVIIATEIGMLVSKKTKVDILVTPVVTLIAGFAASWLLCPLVSFVMFYLGNFIALATTFQPILRGIVISVVMGIILTLPISSAAICSMIFSADALVAAALNGTAEGLLLAGGAAADGQTRRTLVARPGELQHFAVDALAQAALGGFRHLLRAVLHVLLRHKLIEPVGLPHERDRQHHRVAQPQDVLLYYFITGIARNTTTKIQIYPLISKNKCIL